MSAGADWTKPITTDAYANWPTLIAGRDIDVAVGLDPAIITTSYPTSPTPTTGLPNGAIRFRTNGASPNLWERWNSTALTWTALAATYNISISGNAATATTATTATNQSGGTVSATTITASGTISGTRITATNDLSVYNSIVGNGTVYFGNTGAAYLTYQSGSFGFSANPVTINGALTVNGGLAASTLQATTAAGASGVVINGAANTTAGAQISLLGNGATTPNKYIRVLNGNFEVLNSAYSTVLLSIADSGAVTVTSSVTAITLNSTAGANQISFVHQGTTTGYNLSYYSNTANNFYIGAGGATASAFCGAGGIAAPVAYDGYIGATSGLTISVNGGSSALARFVTGGLFVAGNVTASGSLVTTSSFQYSTGAGVSITGIALSGTATTTKMCGQLAFVSSAFTAGTSYTMTLSNINIAATDTIILSGGSGLLGVWHCYGIAAGTAYIMFVPNSSGTNTASVNFAIIKAVNA